MAIRLVSYTQPTEEFKAEGLENVQDLIAFCAKVSNPAAQINKETSERLIKYLIKHQHWSPLEMANAVLEIDTTRDIAHQIVRHRSFAFQEFSQRYADPAEQGDIFEYSEARLQDTKNRQNSIDIDLNNAEDRNLMLQWERRQQMVIDTAKSAYTWAVDHGLAKEQARAVLPEGNTVSRMYMNGTLRSWIHFCELRSGNGTQKEHMEVARACAKAIADIFPMADEFVEK